MDFQLSDDQLAIQDAVAKFFQEEWNSDIRRDALDDGPVKISDEIWQQIVEMGWIGIAVSEEHGGSGLELLTAAMLAEEGGQVLFPSKLCTAFTTAFALDQCQSGDTAALLTDHMTGQQFVSLAVDEANGTFGPENNATAATLAGDGGTISGEKILVPDAECADCFLVAVRLNDSGALVKVAADAPGLTITAMQRIDGQSISSLQLADVPFSSDDILGGTDDADQVLLRTYEFWTTLISADLLGVTTKALEMTNEYAKVRQQFNKPIGSFQAVSHRLADVKVAEEVGRSLLYGACLALQENPDQCFPQVSAAKAWLSDAAAEATEAALQLHGGIGYTWELDVHLLLRQARSHAVYLGDAAYHRKRIGNFITG
ncbi:MAG: acyl-CoA/acyl-ACP dehydrogenase [Gammaproteobacteria bacterium]|jgi:alkylation response protein AidB-like acyl-CoA dehydrogenase|nr:acyl-CoA/acyl-ACP dehydrogenase [Gammaproteobacteria bacterium]